MKTAANVVADTIQAECPHCGEPLEDSNGSFMITSDSFPSNVATCVHCAKDCKLPQRVRVFA